MRTAIFLLLCISTCVLHRPISAQGMGGSSVHHHWSRSYNRLLFGGDGRYYLFQNRSGNFWNFGQTGEARGRCMVFDSTLRLIGNERVTALEGGRPLHVYEAFSTQDGIRIVAVAPSGNAQGAYLVLGRPAHGNIKGAFTCDTLLHFPKFNHRLQSPRFRVAWSPDSSITAISWHLSQDLEAADNGHTVLLLDKDFKPIRPPFCPLVNAGAEVHILGMAVPDTSDLIYHLRVIGDRNLVGKPNAVGQVIAHYEHSSHTLSPIAIGPGIFPIDIKLHVDRTGQYWALGTYVGSKFESPAVGLYAGRLSTADTLRDLRLHPFPDSIAREFLLPKAGGGRPEIRYMFHNLLFEAGNDVYYVQNLRGPALNLHPETLTGRHLGLLMAWRLDSNLAPKGMRLYGFCQEGRTDYQETYSWRPIEAEGRGFALVTDFGAVRKIARPLEASTYLLPLGVGQGPKVVHAPGRGDPFVVLSPRTASKVGPGEWVFIGRSHKTLRLIKLNFNHP